MSYTRNPDRDFGYSPLMQGLLCAFNAHARSSRYLLVYWQGWGEQTEYVPVKESEDPWEKDREFRSKDRNASFLAIAFDLKRDFDNQVPPHMRQFETLQSFAFRPLVWVPDENGHIDAQQREADVRRALGQEPLSEPRPRYLH